MSLKKSSDSLWHYGRKFCSVWSEDTELNRKLKVLKKSLDSIVIGGQLKSLLVGITSSYFGQKLLSHQNEFQKSSDN